MSELYQIPTNYKTQLDETGTVVSIESNTDATNRITLTVGGTIHFHKSGLVAKVGEQFPHGLELTIDTSELHQENPDQIPVGLRVYVDVLTTPLLFSTIEDIKEMQLQYVHYL